MEVAAFCPSSAIATFNTTQNSSIKLPKTPLQTCKFCPITTSLKPKKNNRYLIFPSFSTASSPTRTNAAPATSTPSTFTTPPSTANSHNRYWMVSMEAPPQGVNSRTQVIDYYVRTLKGVLGNEKDAQMCIYHASWATHFGFCCDIDEETSLELARVPGVLSVRPDDNFDSANKDYGGENLQLLGGSTDSSVENGTANIKTKKLFVAGLSFYTSEKTLRAAFEGFGDLVQVKVIMDKISKRSKGYAFIEYTTKEAAAAALKEMNGKIINGWMITVDVARTNPPKSSRGLPGPAT